MCSKNWVLLLWLYAPVHAHALPQQLAPLPGNAAIEVAAGDQEHARIARGEDGYLVVWEDTRAAKSGTLAAPNGLDANSDIHAARLDSAGNLLDPTGILVNQAPWNQKLPAVAWNGENYLVVWYGDAPSPTFYSEGVYAARVSPSGEVLDDPPILIDDDEFVDEGYPVVTSDGTNWVVWYQDNDSSSGFVGAARVHPIGLVLEKRVVKSWTSGFDAAVNFEASFAGGRHMLTWQTGGGSGNVFARLYDTQLNSVTGDLQLSTSAAHHPGVASNGSDFYVTWVGGGIRGRSVSSTGVLGALSGALNETVPIGSGSYPEAAWNGSGWTVGFQSFSFSAPTGSTYGIAVKHTNSAGIPLAAPPLVVASPGEYVSDPVLANGNGEVQMVWTDQRLWQSLNNDPYDLYGARVSPTGGVQGTDYPVTTGTPAQIQPAIAGDLNAGFMVAYLSDVSGRRDVMVQRLGAGGAGPDPQPTVVASGSHSLRNVDLAWNGSVWLVVWEDLITVPNASPGFLFGKRIAADGTVLDATPLAIQPGNLPAAAAIGDTFLIAGRHHNTSIETVRARRLRDDGTFLDPAEFIVANSSGPVDVVGFDSRWLIVRGGVSGNFVELDGTPGATFLIAFGSSGDSRAHVARSGDTALVVFAANASLVFNADIRARRVLEDGTLLDTAQGTVVSAAPHGQFIPQVAFDGRDWFCAWNDYRAHTTVTPGIGDVYGTRIALDGTVEDLAGIPIATDLRRPESAPAVAGDGGFAQVAYSELLTAGYGAHRVVVRSFAGEAGTSFCFGDGSGTMCPCQNEVPFGTASGCLNGTGQGAVLQSSGGASVASDTLRFELVGATPATFAVLVSGNNALPAIDPGAGIPAFDGLRCVGGNLVRHGSRATDGSGAVGVSNNGWGPPSGPAGGILAQGGFASGQIRRFQVFYREFDTLVCQTGQNTSNAVEVLVGP